MRPDPLRRDDPSPQDPRWARIALALTLAWFAARLLYLAIAVDPAVPPDEETHVGRALAWSHVWGLPTAGPDNYELGLLTHRPFLYAWLMGRVASLGALFGNTLLVLRLANAGMALGTAIYGLRFVRVVSREPLTHVLFGVLLTNTLMFTGLGAAVSYDNGANLLAAASFYYGARLLRAYEPTTLFVLALTLGLGCLTKRSFLPLAALLGGVAVVAQAGFLRDWRDRRAWGRVVREAGRPLSAAVAIALLANAILYGGNWIRFGKLVPGFEQVVGVDAARNNRIFERDWILDGYREGRLELSEALRLTSTIRHPADRDSTRLQLAALRKRGDFRVGPLAYASLWGRIMLDRSMGYFGHRAVYPRAWERLVYAGVLALALALYAWRLVRRRSLAGRGMGAMAAVALAYALVLLLFVNHPNYVARGILDAGVQGRYLFPVWVPAMAFVASALAEAPVRALRVPLALAVGAFFVYGDLPTLLWRSPPGFFGP